MTVKKIIYILATATVLIIIYLLSDQSGTVSSQLSNNVGARITDTEIGSAEVADIDLKFKIFGFELRKLAHILLYFALGVASSLMFVELIKNKRLLLCAAVTLIFCTVCAMADEIHQTFVPGRSGLASDVMIDAIGYTLAVAVVFAFCYILRKREKYLQ